MMVNSIIMITVYLTKYGHQKDRRINHYIDVILSKMNGVHLIIFD